MMEILDYRAGICVLNGIGLDMNIGDQVNQAAWPRLAKALPTLFGVADALCEEQE
jgi:hypothetical protein